MPALLSLSCVLAGPAGAIQLEQNGVYKLEKSTRNTRSVSHRKVEATNPFVEGSFTVSSVRENITEQVSIYVYATTTTELRTRINAVTAALDQIRYSLAFTTDGDTETWTCMAADYTVEASHEQQHAYMANIKATIPRLPKVSYS